MSRLLPQTLIRTSSSSYKTLFYGKSSSVNLSISPRILTQRHRSNQSGKAQLFQVELESDGETEVLGIRKLEDVVHNIVVRRSAPDWLPFVPGASYWVPPPRRPHGLIEVLGKLHNPFMGHVPISSSSHNSVRGWPSSAFYIEGRSAPDWLPFVPGASYWVPPPRRPHGLVEVLGKLHNPFMGHVPMSSSSHNSVRGWPSAAFYIEGTSSTYPVPVDMEVEVEVNVHTNLENSAQAEDEES